MFCDVVLTLIEFNLLNILIAISIIAIPVSTPNESIQTSLNSQLLPDTNN